MSRDCYIIKSDDTDCSRRSDGELFDEIGWTILVDKDLGFPDFQEIVSAGGDYEEYFGQFEAARNAIKQAFPLIGRLLEEYSDVIFLPREISSLESEIDEMLKLARMHESRRFLLKFQAFCRKALLEDSGLAIIAD